MRNRKWIALLLVMTLLLAGCGSKEPQASTIKPAELKAPAETTAPAVETTVPEETTAPEEIQHVSLGTMTGGIYENPYTGYACELDDHWIYRSAEEIQDISDLTQELLDGSAIDSNEDSHEQITDMMAENSDDLMTINVLYQRLSTQERLAFALFDESEVIDFILEGKDDLVSSYAQAGIDVISMEKVNVPFLGETTPAIYTVADIQGISYYILQIMDYSLGNYGVTLTLGSFLDDRTSEMLELFYPLD